LWHGLGRLNGAWGPPTSHHHNHRDRFRSSPGVAGSLSWTGAARTEGTAGRKTLPWGHPPEETRIDDWGKKTIKMCEQKIMWQKNTTRCTVPSTLHNPAGANGEDSQAARQGFKKSDLEAQGRHWTRTDAGARGAGAPAAERKPPVAGPVGGADSGGTED